MNEVPPCADGCSRADNRSIVLRTTPRPSPRHGVHDVYREEYTKHNRGQGGWEVGGMNDEESDVV